MAGPQWREVWFPWVALTSASSLAPPVVCEQAPIFRFSCHNSKNDDLQLCTLLVSLSALPCPAAVPKLWCAYHWWNEKEFQMVRKHFRGLCVIFNSWQLKLQRKGAGAGLMHPGMVFVALQGKLCHDRPAGEVVAFLALKFNE